MKLCLIMIILVIQIIKTIPDNNNVTSSQPAKNIIITFTISDTGIGIKSENISHLFDSFSRFDENKTNI